MTITSRAAMALAATLLSPLAAHAADYDPPIVIEEAPEYVPVEVGSGWYLRGDVGYNINKSPYNFTLLGVETRNTSITGSIGAGYHFTDYFRGELNLGFLSNDRYDATFGTETLSLENNVWNGMANAYVDLGTIAGFTPYVGAGIGLIYSSHTVKDTDPAAVPPLDFYAHDTQYKMAYSVGAGVAYQVAQNTSIDVGYQYLTSPDLEYVDVNTLTVKKGVDYHQVKVGLRYDLW
ncbi:outer membrane protein [Aminobacter sp. HY435]|uniref:outer membrane protein n=1 Tax=Aminobacter sp. HY435 TaxID=2970917 RepID=UPI0022B984C8|nr:outer membrane protein [Aminobacter sp. HY435]